jgi:ubiquinone/menaquinone biosynthesis C-methylase UbiE
MPHKFDPAHRARLEAPDRARLLPPEALLRRAGLGEGMRVGDLGCGPGFFTVPAARIVGRHGRVFAVDISDELLRVVRNKAAAAGLTQIEAVRAEEDHIPLRDASIDVALLAFVLHEAVHPTAFIRETARVLADHGHLLVLEWQLQTPPAGPPVGDRLGPATTVALLKDVGFVMLEHFTPNPLHYGLLAVRLPVGREVGARA